MSHRMSPVHSMMQHPLAMSRIQVNFLNEIPDCSTVWPWPNINNSLIPLNKRLTCIHEGNYHRLGIVDMPA
jgi:hypothetical protein